MHGTDFHQRSSLKLLSMTCLLGFTHSPLSCEANDDDMKGMAPTIDAMRELHHGA